MRHRSWLIAIGLFALGSVYGWQSRVRESVKCEGGISLSGVILEVYRVREESIQYVVAANFGCRILASLPRFPLYSQGDELELYGKVEPLSEMPAQYAGYAEYLQRRGIGGTMRFPKVKKVSVGEKLIKKQVIQNRIQQIFQEPEASLVAAMVLNNVGTIPEDMNDQFQRTGVNHIISISGLHVTVITGALAGLLLFLPIPRWLRGVILTVVLWAYILFVGAPVAAQRAGWFWTLLIMALQLRRLVGLPTVLIVTALIIISAWPLALHDISFQLSLAGVAGVWLAPFLFKTWAKSWWRTLLVSSMGATVMTAPLVSFHFGSISFVSILANLLIIPPASAFLILSLAGLLVSFLVPFLGLIFSFTVHLLWLWMDMVTRFLSAWRWAAVSEIYLPTWGVFACYAAVVAFSIWLMRFQKRTWREVWE